jgi:ABC-type polar amino acid transport system ATPase subunit
MASPKVATLLRVEGLRVSYGSHQVISNFQIDLPAKSCTAIVGSSGCGKSTMLRALVGLLPATSGNAWLSDDPFMHAGAITVHPWSLRRQMSLVTQQPGLLPQRTVLENLTLAMNLVLGEESQKRSQTPFRVREITGLLGIDTHLNSYPNQLSGGQLQRAHLARALVLNPKVLLLDEVTSNVDPRTSEAIVAALAGLRQKQGISIILVTHDFAAVKNLADNVIFLYEGRNFEELPSRDFPDGFKTVEAATFARQPARLDQDDNGARQ